MDITILVLKNLSRGAPVPDVASSVGILALDSLFFLAAAIVDVCELPTHDVCVGYSLLCYYCVLSVA